MIGTPHHSHRYPYWNSLDGIVAAIALQQSGYKSLIFSAINFENRLILPHSGYLLSTTLIFLLTPHSSPVLCLEICPICDSAS